MAAIFFRGKHSVIVPSTSAHLLLPLSFSSSSSVQSPPSDPNTKPHDETVSSVTSILKHQRSKSRWNFIKTLHPTGFTPKQVSQITLNVRNNPRLAIRFFLWTQRKSLCTHDLLSYSTIIHVLARSRLKTLAQSLIQSALTFSSNPSKVFESLTRTYRYCDSAPFVFDLLIKACLDAKKIDAAVEIVRMLRSKGIYPNISTCNLLIKLVSQVRGSQAAFEMYREIFSFDDNARFVRVFPNVQTYNTIMICFYQDGFFDKVEELWNEMAKFPNCVRNVFNFSIFMAALCDQGKIGEMMRLFEEMQLNKEIKPDVMVYNTLIRGLCENMEMGRAEELFREMGLNEIEATCVTYENLIKGYCKIGDVDSAILLYKGMCRKDFEPEGSTIEQVIRELCDKDRISEGLKFMKDVMRKWEGFFYPTKSTYEFLIRGLCEDGKMEEALMLQGEMVAKGFGPPNLEIYNVFIDGYSKQENYEKVNKLRKEMLEISLLPDGD